MEKGLKFAQQRNEEIANIRFQIQVLSQNMNPEDGNSKSAIDKLLMTYNGWMYPHLDLERKDFVRDGVKTFEKLKDKHKGLNLKAVPIDSNEKLNINFGK